MTETVPTPKPKKPKPEPKHGIATVVLRQRKGDTSPLTVVFPATSIEFGYASNTLLVKRGSKIVATFNAGVWERAFYDDGPVPPHLSLPAQAIVFPGAGPVPDENPQPVDEAA
jgi:hypothetical protein